AFLFASFVPFCGSECSRSVRAEPAARRRARLPLIRGSIAYYNTNVTVIPMGTRHEDHFGEAGRGPAAEAGANGPRARAEQVGRDPIGAGATPERRAGRFTGVGAGSRAAVGRLCGGPR